MKKQTTLLFIFLMFIVHVSAQVVYDTIPDKELRIGEQWWEKTMIFKDFEHQALQYFNQVDFKNLDGYGKTVFVSTVFGKNGALKDTRVIKSENPRCDSIAYYFVSGLKDWLPGLSNGRFVDVPFTFSIVFDSVKIKDMYSVSNVSFFTSTDEEYAKRKMYFDFVYDEQYDREIINDFDFFKKYVAEILSSQYLHILTDYRLKREESIRLTFSIHRDKALHVLVWDEQKEHVLYDYNLYKKKIRVPKDKKLFLVFYKEGETPLLQTMTIHPHEDMTVRVALKPYTKGRLLEEINKAIH